MSLDLTAIFFTAHGARFEAIAHRAIGLLRVLTERLQGLKERTD